MKNIVFTILFCLVSNTYANGYAPWGDLHWRSPVASVGALPSSGNLVGDVRIETTAFNAYVWNGTTWQELGAGGGGPPTGPAGGDLGGTYPNPTVTGIGDVTTGILGIANGGTGASSFYPNPSPSPSNYAVVSNGSGYTLQPYQPEAYPNPSPSPSGAPLVANGSAWVAGHAYQLNPTPSPSSYVLTANGSAWVAASPQPVSPTGSAGGDLSGTYPNPTVAKVNGNTPGGTCSVHQWVETINSSAVPSCTQPSFTDITGSVTAAQMLALASGDVYVGNGSNQPSPTPFYPNPSPSPSGVPLVSNGSAWVAGQNYQIVPTPSPSNAPMLSNGSVYVVGPTYDVLPTPSPSSYVLTANGSAWVAASPTAGGGGSLPSPSPSTQFVQATGSGFVVAAPILSLTFAGNSGGTSGCSTSPCTIVSQSSPAFVASNGVVRAGAGSYTITFTPSLSTAPRCVTSSQGLVANDFCFMNGIPSLSTVKVDCFTGSGATDEGVTIICTQW